MVIVAIEKERSQEEEEERKRKEEKERKYALEVQRQNDKMLLLDKLTTLIQSPSKIIEYNYDHFVIINEEQSQIMLNEHIYNFRDILDYQLYDDTSSILHHSGTEITTTTSTDTGSMVGRAIVGGVIAGGVGAAIGASTASKDSVSVVAPSTSESSTLHDYLISVTVNSLSNPIERLRLLDDETSATEICSLLSVIITRNKNHENQQLLNN